MLNATMLNVVDLNVAILNVSMLNLVMLNIAMLNAIMLNVVILSVTILNVIMPNVVFLSVVAPLNDSTTFKASSKKSQQASLLLFQPVLATILSNGGPNPPTGTSVSAKRCQCCKTFYLCH